MRRILGVVLAAGLFAGCGGLDENADGEAMGQQEQPLTPCGEMHFCPNELGTTECAAASGEIYLCSCQSNNTWRCG